MEQRGARNARFVQGPGNNQIAYPLLKLLIEWGCFSLQHMELGFVSVLGAEPLHGGGQVAGAYRGDGPNVDGARKAAVAAVELGNAALDGGKPRRNVLQEHAAVIGELHVAAGFAEQLAPELLFQRGNGMRKGRLRDVQAFGRASVMLGFRKMAKVCELGKVHRRIPFAKYR